MSVKLEKNVAIARSGIYRYLRSEIPGFKLPPIPEKYSERTIFNVYRPALVLEKTKDMFTKLPLISGHKGVVDGDNFRDWALGWTGDSATIEYQKESGEVVIRSTVNILDSEGKDLYDGGTKEVSPWYEAKFSWREGVQPDGTDYQIVMDSVDSVNHLAIVEKGRGGPSVAILDQGGVMKFKTGLWYKIKRLLGVKDDDLGGFRESITELVKGKDSLSEEEIRAKVVRLKDMTMGLPAGDELSLLDKYLDDFSQIKNLSNDVALKGAETISDLFEKLDTEIMNTEEKQEMTKDEEMKAQEEKKCADEGETLTPEKGQYLLKELENLFSHLRDGKDIKDFRPGAFGEEKTEVAPEVAKDEAEVKTEPKAEEKKEEPKKEPEAKDEDEPKKEEMKEEKAEAKDSSPFNSSFSGKSGGGMSTQAFFDKTFKGGKK